MILLLLMGCMNMRLEVNIDYPRHIFKETTKKIDRLHKQDPTRIGKVSNFNLLLYDGSDRKLIGLTVPLIVVEKSLKDYDNNEYQKYQRYSRKYLRIHVEEIQDLHQLGPGLLVEIELVHNNTHILIWLD
jgi:hypothetical protein